MEKPDIEIGVIAEILLREEALPGAPIPVLLVSLPIDALPGKDESELLGKIRKAIGIPPGLVRYRYYLNQAEEREYWADCPIHFLFGSAPSGIEQCSRVNREDGRIRIEMPALSEMMVREDLKREVWKTIRPLGGR